MPGVADVIIESFDPVVASDADLRAFYALDCAIERELDPDTPQLPFDPWVAHIRPVVSFRQYHRWLAWDSARTEVLAFAFLGLEYTEANQQLASFHVQVARACRRQGLARRLLANIVAGAEADGRTVLGAGAVQGHVGEAFLAAIGMEEKMVERRSRLPVREVDGQLLDQWVADGEAKSAEYSLHLFDGAVPEEYLLRFAELLHTMNDAPRDDLDMEDEVVRPEQIREREAHREATGQRLWTLVVRHDPTDELAGFTTIAWDPAIPEIAWQYGTAVRSAHRGHGIGRWLKAAMLIKVRTERPEVAFIDTWNAGSNKWMLAINIDLGFAPFLHYTDWQGATETLKAAVEG